MCHAASWKLHQWKRGYSLIGRLSNDDDDDDVNANGQKAKGLVGKTKTLPMHHAFLYISLPSPHDYDVKLPIFTVF